jgi:CubicO group peptidase (beta-lactamase class C family)
VSDERRAAGGVPEARRREAGRPEDAPRDAGLPPNALRRLDLLLGVAAKVLASAVFVSGRELDEAARHSMALPLLARRDPGAFRTEVDPVARTLTVSYRGGLWRRARHVGAQGCVVLPAGRDVLFRPLPVETRLPDAASQPWPDGDAAPSGPETSRIDRGRAARALDAAFARRSDQTAAFLVVHRGEIVAERYAEGIGPDTQLESWSMGKSLTAALVGVCIGRGDLDLQAPPPLPEWSDPDDPRRAIRVADLLRMSSGLRFSRYEDAMEFLRADDFDDHTLVYAGVLDVFRFSATRPAEHPPGRVGRYRNCDTLSLGYAVQRVVRAGGEEYLRFPQQALFDRIGIRRQVLETDAYGNFISSGFDYGTARSWARLGLLFLCDGTWHGERILPEGFVRFLTTPAPAWPRPEYGGQLWLNAAGTYPMLPPDTFWFSGNGVQRVFVVPSLELVVVRLGHTSGALTADAGLRDALGEIASAVRLAAH